MKPINKTIEYLEKRIIIYFINVKSNLKIEIYIIQNLQI